MTPLRTRWVRSRDDHVGRPVAVQVAGRQAGSLQCVGLAAVPIDPSPAASSSRLPEQLAVASRAGDGGTAARRRGSRESPGACRSGDQGIRDPVAVEVGGRLRNVLPRTVTSARRRPGGRRRDRARLSGASPRNARELALEVTPEVGRGRRHPGRPSWISVKPAIVVRRRGPSTPPACGRSADGMPSRRMPLKYRPSGAAVRARTARNGQPSGPRPHHRGVADRVNRSSEGLDVPPPERPAVLARDRIDVDAAPARPASLRGFGGCRPSNSRRRRPGREMPSRPGRARR